MENVLHVGDEIFFPADGDPVHGYISMRLIHFSKTLLKTLDTYLSLEVSNIYFHMYIFQKKISKYVEHYVSLGVNISKKFIIDFCQLPNFVLNFCKSIPRKPWCLKEVDYVMLHHNKYLKSRYLIDFEQIRRYDVLIKDSYFMILYKMQRYYSKILEKVKRRSDINMMKWAIDRLQSMKEEQYRFLIVPTVLHLEYEEECKEMGFELDRIRNWIVDQRQRLYIYLIEGESFKSTSQFRNIVKLKGYRDDLMNILQYIVVLGCEFSNSVREAVDFVKRSKEYDIVPNRDEFSHLWCHGYKDLSYDEIQHALEIFPMTIDMKIPWSNLHVILLERLNLCNNQTSILEILHHYWHVFIQDKHIAFPSRYLFQSGFYTSCKFVHSMKLWTRSLRKYVRTINENMFHISDEIENASFQKKSTLNIFEKFVNLIRGCFDSYTLFGESVLKDGGYFAHVERTEKNQHCFSIERMQVSLRQLTEFAEGERVLLSTEGNATYKRTIAFISLDLHHRINISRKSFEKLKSIATEKDLKLEHVEKLIIEEYLDGFSPEPLSEEVDPAWFVVDKLRTMRQIQSNPLVKLGWKESSQHPLYYRSQWIYLYLFEKTPTDSQLAYFTWMIVKPLTRDQITHLCLLKWILGPSPFTIDFCLSFLQQFDKITIHASIPLFNDTITKHTLSLFHRLLSHPPEPILSFANRISTSLKY